MAHRLKEGAVAKIQRWVRTRLWGMDIHPTARIETGAMIDRTWPRGVHIGPDTHIAEQAVLLTHDYTRGLYLDTRIGARCYVGPRAVVLPGVSIGDDCVVMPGALVNRDVPAEFPLLAQPDRALCLDLAAVCDVA